MREGDIQGRTADIPQNLEAEGLFYSEIMGRGTDADNASIPRMTKRPRSFDLGRLRIPLGEKIYY